MRLQYGEIFVEKLLGGKQTGMQVEKISCNSCGAPLEVAETTQFATCRHCGAKLSIQRTDTATFTEAFHNWVILGQEGNKKKACAEIFRRYFNADLGVRQHTARRSLTLLRLRLLRYLLFKPAFAQRKAKRLSSNVEIAVEFVQKPFGGAFVQFASCSNTNREQKQTKRTKETHVTTRRQSSSLTARC